MSFSSSSNQQTNPSDRSRRGRARSTSLLYIPLDVHFEDHPRVAKAAVRLSRALNLPDRKLGSHYIVRLWLHAGRRAIDGNLGAIDAEDLALMVDWPGDPEVLWSTLFGAGLLEDTEDGVCIRDWEDHGGRAYAKRKKNAEKLRRYRSKAKTPSKENSDPEGNCNGYNPRQLGYAAVEGEGEKERERESGSAAVIFPSGLAGDLSDCDTYPDDRRLPRDEVSALLSRPQLGVELFAGNGGTPDLGFSFVAAWELRTALRACLRKPEIGRPDLYAVSVISNGRDRGWKKRPAKRVERKPRASKPAPQQPRLPAHKPFVRDEPVDRDVSQYREEALAAMRALGVSVEACVGAVS